MKYILETMETVEKQENQEIWDWYEVGGRFYGDLTKRPCPSRDSCVDHILATPVQTLKDNMASVRFSGK